MCSLPFSPLPAKLTVTCGAPDATVRVGTGGPPVRAGRTPLDVPSLVPVTLVVSAPRRETKTVSLAPMDPARDYSQAVELDERKEPRPGEERAFEIAPGVEMRFCWIPATTSADWKRPSGGQGHLHHGQPADETGRDNDEELNTRCGLRRAFDWRNTR